jgi:hypothetical protein
MNSDDLIKNLSNDLKPVKKQSSPNVFAIRCLVFLILITITGIVLLRIRNDLQAELINLSFVIDICFNVFVLLSGIFLTAWFSTAGRIYNKSYKFIMLLLFVSILGFNVYRLSLTTIFYNKFTVNVFDLKCFLVVMALSLLSIFIMIFAVSKRIVFNAGLVGSIIGLLSFSVGSFVIGMHCPLNNEEHVTLYHAIIPMITGAFIGFLSGKVFLKI